MMRTVHLYGALERQFGSEYRLDVRSLSEAAQALGCQLPGFRKAIQEGQFRVSCGPSQDQGMALHADLISFGLPAGDIHIMPVAAGAGGGIGELIVGSLMLGASFVPGVGTVLGATGLQILGGLGASIALTGAAELLSPQKEEEQQLTSYMFNGADNTAEAGGCVPLIIGTCMVNPVTISVGVTTSDSNGLV